MSLKERLEQQEKVLTDNRDFIVKYLDPDDVIDELIQDHLIGENAAQKVTQVIGLSREDKNRIIVDQLRISGPGAVESFCEIIRRKKRQIFIAEELEKLKSEKQLEKPKEQPEKSKKQPEKPEEQLEKPEKQPEIDENTLKEQYHKRKFEANVIQTSTNIEDLKRQKLHVLIQTVNNNEYCAVMLQLKEGSKAVQYECSDGPSYLVGKWGKAGIPVVIIQTHSGKDGPRGSYNETKKALELLPHLKYIFAVGVCGGVKCKVDLGDVVVSTVIQDYSALKIKDGKWINRSPHWDITQRTDFHQFLNREANNTKLGMVLSSNVLVADAVIQEYLLETYPDAIGFEMEGNGIASACDDMHKGEIICMVVKGVSDLADKKKDDNWQPQAALNAAEALYKAMESYKKIGGNYTTESNTNGSAPIAKQCLIDVSRLKARYLDQQPTCKTDWPRHNVFQYVRLALVEKEDVIPMDEHLNDITKLTLKGEVDKILKKKKPLSNLKDIFYYKNKPCPRLILIMGGPGIGKTTLANEICVQWARDGFLTDEFDAVILVPLRSVQQRSLKNVIMEHVGEEDYPKLKKSAGRRCLLILEGLDEMAFNHRKDNEILKRLIEENTLLEKAKILITSRPHACEMLVVDRRIEVVGFGDKQISEFVESSFPDDVKSIEEFMKQLTEYPQLRSLCYVPLNLVMIVDIFRFSQKKLPSTLTELYRLFIVMILQREITKGSVKKLTVTHNVEKILCKMLRGIPKEAVGIVHLLCKLAYHAFFKPCDERECKFDFSVFKIWLYPKIIFTESDLTESGIEVTSDFDGCGLVKATHTHQLPKDTVTYNFLHLTVQEFLCSLYMATLSQQEQLNLLSEHFREYPYVMMFLCGLTGLASNEIFKFVCSELLTNKPLLQNNVITALRCVYESNKSDLSHLTSPFTVQMSMNALLPYDCLCLSWLLSCYPVSQLKMFSCHIEDTGAELLVRHYPNKNTTGQLLEEVNLMDNNLTIAGLKKVMKIVRASGTTLRVLNIGANKINDDGISMMSEELQHNNQLIELSIFHCGLSKKGATGVSKVIKGKHTLQVLNMQNNDVGDDGISVIVEQLRHITTLTKLYISNCGISVKGATVISDLLMDNSVIQELKMSDNPIGDDGITAITTALTNGRISTLFINNCKFTLTGARSLATLLSVTQTIKNLEFSGNTITTEGTRLILQSIVNNKACQVDNIRIEDEYSRDSKVQAMLKGIKQVVTANKMGNIVISTSSCPMVTLQYTELTTNTD